MRQDSGTLFGSVYFLMSGLFQAHVGLHHPSDEFVVYTHHSILDYDFWTLDITGGPVTPDSGHLNANEARSLRGQSRWIAGETIAVIANQPDQAGDPNPTVPSSVNAFTPTSSNLSNSQSVHNAPVADDPYSGAFSWDSRALPMADRGAASYVADPHLEQHQISASTQRSNEQRHSNEPQSSNEGFIEVSDLIGQADGALLDMTNFGPNSPPNFQLDSVSSLELMFPEEGQSSEQHVEEFWRQASQ